MSSNNEHLHEFIMLANIMRDAAAMLEKAYRKAVTEGAPTFEDPECDHIVSHALTAGMESDDAIGISSTFSQRAIISSGARADIASLSLKNTTRRTSSREVIPWVAH